MCCRRYNNIGMDAFVFIKSGYIKTSAKQTDSRLYVTLHDRLSQFIYSQFTSDIP